MANYSGKAEIPSMWINPNYLRTNSQSHETPFSAFAELIDNAYDAQANLITIQHKIIKKNGLYCFNR